MTPRGYKQTEVGIIPEDWRVDSIGNICILGSGTTPPRSMHKKYYENGIICWVKTGDLNNAWIHSTEELVTQFALNETSLKVYPTGTVLIAMYGGFNQIGRTGLLKVPSTVNQAITAIQSKERTLEPEYLLNYLNFKVDYWKTVASSSRKDPNITSTDVRKFLLPLPPTLHEQRLIAEALSEVDAELSALDAALAKKRDLKQGAMQELLTGQTRLPGFSGAWKEWSFDELFSILRTASNSRSQLTEEGEVRYIHYGDIHQRWSTFLDCEKESLPAIDYYLVQNFPFLQEGDLIMADASEDYEGIGASVEVKNIGDIKAVAGLHTILLRGDKSLLADRFKGYLQYIPSVKRRLIELATGISVYGISKTSVQAIRVFLPSKEEQTPIAAILSEMDTEINILEAQRQKTADLKQGMMQELLTGKTRLI